MARINDTTTFPITTPADDDLLIGTDVSNTTNNAGGETVNFTARSIADLVEVGISKIPNPFVLAESVVNTLSGPTTSDYADTALVGSYRVALSVSQAAGADNFEVRLSDDDGTTWSATLSLSNVFPGNLPSMAECFINVETGAVTVIVYSDNGPTIHTGTAATPAGAVNAVQVRAVDRTYTAIWYAMSGRSS